MIWTRVAGFTGKKVSKGELIAEIDAADFEIQGRADKAEIGRLTSLLDQQEKVVERQTKLVGQGFISQNAIDDAIAQRNALRQQLAAAEARERALAIKARKLVEIALDEEDDERWIDTLIKAAIELHDYMQGTPAPAAPDLDQLMAGIAAGA